MRLLGFSGRAQHGKDTCALIARRVAAEEFGLSMAGWAFAHPLKAQVYGQADGKFTLTEVLDTKPPHVRNRLQQAGTEEGRMRYGEDIWTLQAEAFVELLSRNSELAGLTFTDVRFPNEVAFIRTGGVVLVPELRRRWETLMTEAGFGAYLDDDPEDSDTFISLLATEDKLIQQLDAEAQDMLHSSQGMALYIQSDRPTLTGDAAVHPSETSLDGLDKEHDFEGVIINNTDTTLADLEEQIRPFVKQLFEL